MKHRNLADATIAALISVFREGEVASAAVERTIALQTKWGKRDRNQFAEAVYEIVRWRRLFEFAAQSEDEWALLGAFIARQGGELAAWPEFDQLDGEQLRARLAQTDLPRAIQESVPDWLDAYGQEQLGERWGEELHALNREADVVVRANTLQISRDELRAQLRERNIESHLVEGVPDALQLASRPRLNSLDLFRRGAFEVQDAASQLVAPFLEVEPEQNVVDACAGAGGKTLHLAALMQNEGRLLALDVSKDKLDELDRRTCRAGVNVKIARIEKQILRDSRAFADRLLLDMPCSGSGTWRRQPDSKWRLNPEFLARLQETQRQILRDTTPMLRPGGKMVYATCSIFPSENERQIEAFLAQNPAFELEAEHTISPSQTGFDGFYMARLRKR
ncbi:ribosomal RNA small subunit methyltransferase B [Abditibacteriota bacterium]|nr:ribosomal RNA small subunit methyltransferase B [Abditibacteriota bacterium]